MRAADREILRLAGPAFLALIAEPLFLLADSAIVGHLGTTELAGLGIAGAILTTLISLCVFLAYGTTAAVARRVGAGDTAGALTEGIHGVWLAVAIGAGATLAGAAGAPAWVRLFGAAPEVAHEAGIYLRIAALGSIPMLVLLAATGILRGLQDTRTPMAVALGGSAANIALNVALVYGLDLGIAGAALGTVIAQGGSAAVLLAVVARGARRHQVGLGPSWDGLRAAGRAGVPLLLRTLSLRASLLVMTYGAASLGSADLAAMQLAMTIWTFLAYALDAIAIAAQALTGRSLGAGDRAGTRALTRRMIGWGVISGIATGLLLAACATVIGPLFTPDAEVVDLLGSALLIAALAQPVAGIVFVLDGVLIGAGDGRYLAWAGLGVLALFAPAAAAALGLGGGLTGLWVAFAVAFMGGRAAVLLTRARGDGWLRLGAT